MKKNSLENICKLIRYDILTSTTKAGSGHPTSSLSAVEIMASLFFSGFFKQDIKKPKNITNDHFILSKGHASPLLYALYYAAGAVSYKEIMSLRQFGSVIEGHPTTRFPYVDIATGSLGQGLSAGIGIALGIRLNIKYQRLNIKRTPKVWVLMGDSEMAEGQIWEAIEIASYYKLNNLVGIIDVNRLGQNSETEVGWDIYNYQKKLEAFGWKTIIIHNGHNLKEIHNALIEVENKRTVKDQVPTMIIARTIKGKGVSFLENKENWHGKALDKGQLKVALKELGKVILNIRGKVALPESQIQISKLKSILIKLEKKTVFSQQNLLATREAFGSTLVELGEQDNNIVVLDAEVANSTFENKFQKRFPDRFFEMFIAEENMMGAALGLSKTGYIPFVSTFAAFLTQTYDQIRMAQYSKANLKIIGSHSGISIGQDGPSQMGLEDIAMARSILESIVFYPSDSVSTKKLTRLMAENKGIFYMRTTRGKTPVIYDEKEEFYIGGLKVHRIKSPCLRRQEKSKALIIAAGITLHESLKAQEKIFKEKKIEVIVVDLYSVKPLDEKNLSQLIKECKNIIVVEDHYPSGGIGEAVSRLIVENRLYINDFKHLCVHKIPMSGTPSELLKYEEIDSTAIIKNITAVDARII